jgi:hypothetical protein
LVKQRLIRDQLPSHRASSPDLLDLALAEHIVELQGHAPHKIGAGLIGLAQREAGVSSGMSGNVYPKMVDGSLPLNKPQRAHAVSQLASASAGRP